MKTLASKIFTKSVLDFAVLFGFAEATGMFQEIMTDVVIAILVVLINTIVYSIVIPLIKKAVAWIKTKTPKAVDDILDHAMEHLEDEAKKQTEKIIDSIKDKDGKK